MTNYFPLVAATLIGLVAVSAEAYETSAPVPIHRTTAKRHVAKPVKKPAATKPTVSKTATPTSAAPIERPAASSAK